ncbi:Teneurin-2, partial [Myotis brandtii]
NHSQSTLRPPLPPPHNHTLSHHHSSANSLNRNSLTNRRSQIHAPAPAPNDLATTPESVQLQDSWVLNSNVPLETRHFLFKTSSGSTPLFSSSSPGYPLTSGTVYTPPPRLLPRNTFSRKAFKLKKPSKYCSWKCAALSAIAAALLLAILLAYFIGLRGTYSRTVFYNLKTKGSHKNPERSLKTSTQLPQDAPAFEVSTSAAFLCFHLRYLRFILVLLVVHFGFYVFTLYPNPKN